MNEINTGGPAFPLIGDWSQVKKEGMTLRDYFAAKALPVMMRADEGRWEGNYQAHAERAYKYADAMLKARNNQGETK